MTTDPDPAEADAPDPRIDILAEALASEARPSARGEPLDAAVRADARALLALLDAATPERAAGGGLARWLDVSWSDLTESQRALLGAVAEAVEEAEDADGGGPVDVARAALRAVASRPAAGDLDIGDVLAANESLGDGLTEIGMVLGLARPRPGATWGVPEVLERAHALMDMPPEPAVPDREADEINRQRLNRATDTLNHWLADLDVEDAGGPPAEVLDAIETVLRAGQAGVSRGTPAPALDVDRAAEQVEAVLRRVYDFNRDDTGTFEIDTDYVDDSGEVRRWTVTDLARDLARRVAGDAGQDGVLTVTLPSATGPCRACAHPTTPTPTGDAPEQGPADDETRNR